MFECPNCEMEYTSATAAEYCDCDRDDVKRLDPWQESE